MYGIPRLRYLIGVREATHTTHDTENVVVDGVDVEVHGVVGKSRGIDGTSEGVSAIAELKDGIINTRKVASARGLVLLRG